MFCIFHYSVNWLWITEWKKTMFVLIHKIKLWPIDSNLYKNKNQIEKINIGFYTHPYRIVKMKLIIVILKQIITKIQPSVANENFYQAMYIVKKYRVCIGKDHRWTVVAVKREKFSTLARCRYFNFNEIWLKLYHLCSKKT